MLSTIQACSEAGIMTVGAGRDVAEAAQIMIAHVKGLRIGVLGMADHEFSIATDKSPGANPIDIIVYTRALEKVKRDLDYLLVLVHSGLSYYPYPSPCLQKLCRFLAEMGANAVICQHSHCDGCIEEYKGSIIVYGQGDFVFDWYLRPDSPWNIGFLLGLDIHKSGCYAHRLVPYTQSPDESGVRLLPPEANRKFIADIDFRSARVNEPGFIQQQWQEHCVSRSDEMLFQFFGGFIDSWLMRKINRIIPISNLLYNRRHALLAQHFIRCESYREALETILDIKNRQ